MHTDLRPDYPVNATFIGGPMHGKRLNLEESALEDGYTAVEGVLFAHHQSPEGVPDAGIGTDNKTRDCEYVFWRQVSKTTLGGDLYQKWERGQGLAIFVPKSLIAPGAWRALPLLVEAREDLRKRSESISEARAEAARLKRSLDDAVKIQESLRGERNEALTRLIRIGRKAEVAMDLLRDVLDETARDALAARDVLDRSTITS